MDKNMQREIIRDLSNEDLIDELNTPTSNYKDDLINEALCRLLKETKETKQKVEVDLAYGKDRTFINGKEVKKEKAEE